MGFSPYPWSAPLNDIPVAAALVRRAAGQGRRGDRADARRRRRVGQDPHAVLARRSSRARTAATCSPSPTHGQCRRRPPARLRPDVIRGIERYKNRLIAYSLGNFAGWQNFGLGGNLSLSGLLTVKIDKAGHIHGGRWLSLSVNQPGVPAMDGSNTSAHLVRSLSASDFANTFRLDSKRLLLGAVTASPLPARAILGDREHRDIIPARARRRARRLHPRDRRRRPARGAASGHRHALSAGAERLPPHRPRQVDLPELRHRRGVRRALPPALRRHQPDEGGAGVHRRHRGRRALARLRLGRAPLLRVGLLRAALRVGRRPHQGRQGLRGRPHAPTRSASIAARSPSPAGRAPGAAGRPRRASTSSRACAPGSSPTAPAFCARASTWPPPTSTCATRSCTASSTRRTRAPAAPGASTRPTTSRTGSPTRSRASRTPSARWSSRPTGRSTTGSSRTCRCPPARISTSSRGSTSRTPCSPSASCCASSTRATCAAGTTPGCRRCPACAGAASPPRGSATSWRGRRGQDRQRRRGGHAGARGAQRPQPQRVPPLRRARPTQGGRRELPRGPDRGDGRPQQPRGPVRREPHGALLARAVDRARRLHGGAGAQVLPAGPRPRGAAALGVLRHLHAVVKDADGAIVELRCTYDPATRGGDAPDGRRPKATLHWVSAAHAVPAEVRLYDHLFRGPVPRRRRPRPLRRPEPGLGDGAAGGLAEPSLADVPAGETVQFERLGYFCPDPDSAPGALVFNRTLTLRDTWAKLQAQGRQDTA